MRVHIVSAQLPCGAAWLANALLELDIGIANLWGFDTANEWQRDDDGASRYVAEHLPWRQTLASLAPGRRFRFRPGLDVRFSHEFPWQGERADVVILMVRDPRDVLHSEWRRQQRNAGLDAAIDLPAFAASPFMQGPISQRDLLWLHASCWLRGAAPVHVVRFEECKHAPVEQLRAVANWLGLSPPHAQLERAVSASEVGHLQTVEAALASADPAARQFNRRGMAYEWRETWSARWHACLGAHWRPLLARLGYDELRLASNARVGFDTAAVLRWRDLAAGQAFDAWACAIEAWKADAG